MNWSDSDTNLVNLKLVTPIWCYSHYVLSNHWCSHWVLRVLLTFSGLFCIRKNWVKTFLTNEDLKIPKFENWRTEKSTKFRIEWIFKSNPDIFDEKNSLHSTGKLLTFFGFSSQKFQRNFSKAFYSLFDPIKFFLLDSLSDSKAIEERDLILISVVCTVLTFALSAIFSVNTYEQTRPSQLAKFLQIKVICSSKSTLIAFFTNGTIWYPLSNSNLNHLETCLFRHAWNKECLSKKTHINLTARQILITNLYESVEHCIRNQHQHHLLKKRKETSFVFA